MTRHPDAPTALSLQHDDYAAALARFTVNAECEGCGRRAEHPTIGITDDLVPIVECAHCGHRFEVLIDSDRIPDALLPDPADCIVFL